MADREIREPVDRAIGRRSVMSETRVIGLGPYGMWDHGWRRQPLDEARRHARSMAAEGRSTCVRVQRRIVDAEIVAVEEVDDA